MRAGRSRWAGRAAENACLALVPAGTGGDQALEPEPVVEARGGTGPPRMFRGLKGALAFDILLIPALKVTHCPLPCATCAMQCTTCNPHATPHTAVPDATSPRPALRGCCRSPLTDQDNGQRDRNGFGAAWLAWDSLVMSFVQCDGVRVFVDRSHMADRLAG